MESIVIISFATIVALLSTAIIKKVAMRHGIGELPNERKIHIGFIPHLGGLGIYLGGLAGVVVAILWKDYYWQMFTLKYVGILTAATMMLIVGILDDTRNINAVIKFIVQFIASSIVIFSGCRVETIINPFGDPFQLGVLSIPLTYLWLIGITNAINLMDGLDGLAAGVSLVALSTFGIISFQQQDWMTFGICLAVIGGILGFLRYNYHPASIFMGDTGSLFVGFLLASIALRGLQNSEGNIALLIPIITLAVPIGDTSLAFFRRLLRGQHPFRADKDHLHHRLIQLGLSHRQAVHIIYLFSILFGLTAYLMSTESRFYGIMLLSLIFLMAIFSLYRLGYLEAQKNKSYLGDKKIIPVKKELAPLSMRRIWHKLLLIISDILMINAAFFITHWFRFKSGLFSNDQIFLSHYIIRSDVLLVFTSLFILLFALNGLYIMRWDVSRFDKIMRVNKVILFGVSIIFIITLEPEHLFLFSRLSIVIYALTLIVFINLGRLILIYIEKKFIILEYTPHNTLLIGSGDKAWKIYKDIQKNSNLLYDIVGVVAKEKPISQLSELEYLGTYEEMPEIIREKVIEEIIIAINERSRDEILNIVALGENMGVTFKILPQMYEVVSGHKTEEVLGHPLIRLFPEQLRPWQLIVKRGIDIIVAILGIILFFPIYLLIFIFLVASRVHPVLLRENRVGKQGNIFGLILFNISEEKNKLCSTLLKSKLYKIPQLLNLLTGSLSLIGPTPESKDVVDVLRRRIKYYNRRFMIRPGMTGWAQLKYRYSESLKEKKEQFKQDIYYLEHMSISFDFRILLRSMFLLFIHK